MGKRVVEESEEEDEEEDEEEEEEEDEEEEEEEEEEEDAPRRKQRKKPKKAPPARKRLRQEHEVNDAKEEQELSQDLDEKHKDDTDEDMVEEKVVPKKKRQGDGHAEAGIIKEVVLKRFMNHEHLSIRFGENVNFVYGENGTGKSAILVGLQTCLGSTCKETSRAGSLKGLIKHGHKEAEIAVTIKNEGSDAYEHDTYGDQITVVRKITPVSSTYKILAANGQTVSSNKHTMQEISAHFKIQVSNPCVIMSQEDAKEFLTGRKKGGMDKYQFFLKATLLDQMIDNVTESKERSDAMKASIVNTEARIVEKQAQLHQYEQAYAMSKKLEDMLKTLVTLKDEKVWARVRQTENEADKVKKEMCELSDRVHKYENAIRTLQEKEKSSAVQAKELQENETAADAKVQETEKALAEGQKARKLVGKQLERVQREAKELQDKLGRVQKRKEQQAKLITKLKQESTRDLEQEEKARQAKIKSLKEELQLDRKSQDQLDTAIRDAEKEDLATPLGHLRQKEEDINRKLNKLTGQLSMMKNNRSDPLAPFGPHATLIQHEIERSDRFSVKPLGPIGAHIKLKDQSMQKWLGPIERCLQPGFIKSYLVDNERDLAVLRDIFKSVKGLKAVPDIVQARRSERCYEVKQLHVNNAYTVFDCLSIEDPWISNVVVDRTGCERQLLMEREEEAYEVAKAMPEIKNVYLLHGGQVMNKGGAISLVPTYSDGRAKFLGVNAEQQIQVLETELEEWRGQKAEVAERLKEMTKRDRDIKQAHDKLSKQREVVVKQVGQRSRALRELEETKVESADDHLAVYMEELQGFNNELAELGSLIEKKEQAVAEAAEKQEQAQQEENAQQADRKAAMTSHREATKALETFVQTGGGQIKKSIKTAEEKQGEAKKLLQEKQRECARMEHLVEEHTKMAKELQPTRIETTKSVKDIEVKIVQYEERIRSAGPRNADDLPTIQNRFFEAKKAFEKDKADVVQLKANHAHLQEAIKERDTMNAKFRKMVARETREMFNELLNSQGHAGDISINHAEKTLTFDVVPNALESASQGEPGAKAAKDTKSLSGGERSYATLAFVMALCESIQAPFRAMDEFDVFMDPVNRRLSMKMLIQTAERLKHRQFIFITPQDISSVRSGPNIRIHKLLEPIRGQRTLQ